jgi:Xaa-Pro aminopeptidase
MIPAATFADRRRRLAALAPGPILLMGNGERSRNLPMNKLPFRQDSTFLYFTGCALPDAAMLLQDDYCTLFVVPPADDDALWHGEVDGLDVLRAKYHVDAVRSIDELASAVDDLVNVRTIAVADESKNHRASELTGLRLSFGHDLGDDGLVDAIIALRRTKSLEEINELRAAAEVTAQAHLACMRGTRAGGHEQRLTAVFQAVLAYHDCAEGYGTILTQSGEVLHSRAHDQELHNGRLLLLDGGAERRSGYGADVTRTWPVSGKFDARQRAAYQAVLDAQKASIAITRPGVRYRAVHDLSCLVLARFLADEKLLRVSPETAVEIGAHAVFYPHGTGHLLGMDVHDLENFGDRPAYPKGQGRPAQFGTRYLRLDLPLEAGWVVTIEPGFYVVPAILADKALRETFADAIDWDRAAQWSGFGGIRIEDDVLVTEEGAEVLTGSIPKEIAELEAIIGVGPTPEERLC